MSASVHSEPPGLFPRFRARFFFGWELGGQQQGSSGGEAGMHGGATSSIQTNRPALKTLDLGALAGSKEDGPPSETQLRRQKYQFFEKQCSEIVPGLYLSGDYVAKNRDIILQHGITHVINCVGFICKEYFQGELEYLTYYLQDTPAEDILCILYNAFEFIDQAVSKGGKVLVHCSQGVSRSATVVIAYLMWKAQKSYDEAYAHVKAARGVANPNIGFTCQLLQWQKRRKAPPARMRMYRIAPHCQHAPLLLVPRLITPPKEYATHTWRALDPRGAFVIQAQSCQYVWVGAKCPPAFAAAAETTARLLPKYEATSSSAMEVQYQGRESPQFLALMDPPELDEDAERRNARRSSITGDVLSTCSLTSFNEGDSTTQSHHSRHPSTHHSRHDSGSHFRLQTLTPFDFATAPALASSPPHPAHTGHAATPPTPRARSPLSLAGALSGALETPTVQSLSASAHQGCPHQRASTPATPPPPTSAPRQQSSPLPPPSQGPHTNTPPPPGPLSQPVLSSQVAAHVQRHPSLPAMYSGSGNLQFHYQQQQQQEGGPSHLRSPPPPRLSLPGALHLPDSLNPNPGCAQPLALPLHPLQLLQRASPSADSFLLGPVREEEEQQQQQQQPQLQNDVDTDMEDCRGEAQEMRTGPCASLSSPMLVSPAPVYLTEALIRGGLKDPGRPGGPSTVWTVTEVEEYTPEFEMYWEALRAGCGVPGGHLGHSSSLGKEPAPRGMRASMGGTLGFPSYMAHRGISGDDMMCSIEDDDLGRAGGEDADGGEEALMGMSSPMLMATTPSALTGFLSADLADPRAHASPRHALPPPPSPFLHAHPGAAAPSPHRHAAG